MRNPLTRHYGQGDLHFVTFSCYRRRPLLGTAQARDGFLTVLNEVRRRHAFRLIGFVLMPEHVHLLISEPATGNPSVVLQVLKQKVSRALSKGLASEDGHFWQWRFYDLNVWSANKIKEKLDYMHGNPTKRKLVRHPKDWPWSSSAHYEKGEGCLIAIDAVEAARSVVIECGGKKSQKPHP